MRPLGLLLACTYDAGLSTARMLGLYTTLCKAGAPLGMHAGCITIVKCRPHAGSMQPACIPSGAPAERHMVSEVSELGMPFSFNLLNV